MQAIINNEASPGAILLEQKNAQWEIDCCQN